MNRLGSELLDLEELLMRNDGMADDGTYSTIVGIANDVSELEDENAKLRELVKAMASRLRWADEVTGGGVLDARLKRQLREVGVEVDG